MRNKKAIITFTLLATLLISSSIASAETLKLGFVTDWEYGTQSKVGHKVPKKAKGYLKRAVGHYNKVYQPEVVIGGGDYISSYGVKKKQAKSQLNSIVKEFRKIRAYRMYLIGNHDLKALSESDVKKVLKINYTKTYYDTKGFRLVLLDTNEKNSKGKYDIIGRMSDEDLVWLDGVLNTTLPVVVFSHHSPIQTPIDSNSKRTNLAGADRVREVLEKYNNVVAVISGHHPINHSESRNGITYVIINDLGSKAAAGTFATLDLSLVDKTASLLINQHGKKPATYTITKVLP